jgi:hypothetical protein
MRLARQSPAKRRPGGVAELALVGHLASSLLLAVGLQIAVDEHVVNRHVSLPSAMPSDQARREGARVEAERNQFRSQVNDLKASCRFGARGRR